MKGKWVLYILVLTVGCITEEVESGYLSQDKVAQLFLDIYKSEIKISNRESGFEADEIWPVYKEIVFERHGITDSVYYANMSYYLAHPRLLDRVYNQLIDSLTLLQQRLTIEADSTIQPILN